MKRRSRSGSAEDAAEAANMTLEEFEAAIQRCLRGYQNTGGLSQGRKSFFKRLVWLEQQRESLFGIEAPKRKFSDR